jgi:hypothetical protein
LDDLGRLAGHTLWACQTSNIHLAVHAALQALVAEGVLARTQGAAEGEAVVYEPTAFGRATFRGQLEPAVGKMVYSELIYAQSRLVLSTELHLLYLATPIDAGLLPVDIDLYRRCVCHVDTALLAKSRPSHARFCELANTAGHGGGDN